MNDIFLGSLGGFGIIVVIGIIALAVYLFFKFISGTTRAIARPIVEEVTKGRKELKKKK